MLNTLKVIGLAISLVVLASCGGGGGSSGGGGGAIYTTQKNNVTTIAGTAGATGSANGPGSTATFNFPWGITTDGTNLYVADTTNNLIRKIIISTRTVTTIAPAASFPTDITTDANGTNLYVTEFQSHTVSKIEIATGTVTTIAGAAGTPGSTDGLGTAATFNGPTGITRVGTDLYVADYYNSTIRKIDTNGNVTTIAGTAGAFGSADGPGPAATFKGPAGITTDGTNLYVTDYFNCTIRKIDITTIPPTVTTIAGNAGVAAGSADGPGATATFYGPYGITTDGTNLYVTDFNNSTIRIIVIASKAVKTVAGIPGTPGFADGTGAGATFMYPAGIATDGTNLYVADTWNSTIREIH